MDIIESQNTNEWEELCFLGIRYRFSNDLTKPKVLFFREAEIHIPSEGCAALALCHPHAWPRSRTCCAGLLHSLAASKSPYLNEPRATPGSELLPNFRARKLGIAHINLYSTFVAQQRKCGSAVHEFLITQCDNNHRVSHRWDNIIE